MPLYHGTRVPFTKGGLVLPGDTTGADHHGLGRSDWVYVTAELDIAIEFAKVAKGRGRPKVFEVLYVGDIERDDSTLAGGEEFDGYRVTEARIVRRVWIGDTHSG